LEEAPEIKEATKTYEDENNTYGIFLEECCVKNKDSELQVSEVGKKYMDWSRDTYEEKSVTYKKGKSYTPKITEELEKENWDIKVHRLSAYNVYRGLAWK
jgi:hypothetical protein